MENKEKLEIRSFNQFRGSRFSYCRFCCALTPKSEIEGEMGDSKMGLHGLMSQKHSQKVNHYYK